MKCSGFACVLVAAVVALGGGLSGPVAAHGEFGEDLEEFHKHIDDYREEVESLVTRAQSIARAQVDGQAVAPKIKAFVEHWESVGVHGAIETRATVTYPGIWQAIAALQQAAKNDVSGDELRALVKDLEAALWQGFGAVRLAANQVRSGQSAPAAPSHEQPSTPAEGIEAIVGQLREAVSAYASGEIDRGKDLIAEAYIQRFEGLEGELIEQNPDLVSSLEKDFNATLPMAMDRGAPVSEVKSELERIVADLQTAKDLLAEAEKSRSDVF